MPTDTTVPKFIQYNDQVEPFLVSIYAYTKDAVRATPYSLVINAFVTNPNGTSLTGWLATNLTIDGLNTAPP